MGSVDNPAGAMSATLRRLCARASSAPRTAPEGKRGESMCRWIRFAAAIAAAVVLAQSSAALAQGISRPIRIVSIAPGGSTTDVIGRLVMDPIARALGQSMYMDNMPGGTGML